MAFSPDGKYFLSGIDTKPVIWETATCVKLKEFSGHTSGILSLGFSPDSKYVLSSSWDNTVRLWDITTGQEAKSILIPNEEGGPKCAIFSPDGNYILVGTTIGVLELWDITTLQKTKTFSGHKDEVRAVKFAKCGKFFISGSTDGTVKLWDVQNTEPLKTFTGHVGPVFDVDLHGKTAVSGGADKSLKLWNIKSGEEIFPVTGHKDSVLSSNLSDDNCFLTSGSIDTTARMWEIVSGKEMGVFEGNDSAVYWTTLSPNNKYVLTTDYDYLKLWDAATAKLIYKVYGHKSRILRIKFTSGGSRFLSGGYKEVKIWDTATGQELSSFVTEGYLTAVDASANETVIACGNTNGDISLLDFSGNQIIQSFKAHQGSVAHLSFINDNKSFISTSMTDKTLKLWSTSGGQALQSIEIGQITDFAPIPFSDNIVILLLDKKILEIWSLGSGTKVAEISQATTPMSVCVSSDGNSLFVSNANGTIYQYTKTAKK